MSVFVLGPATENVLETATPSPPPPGRQRIDWAAGTSWAPGGRLFLRVLPKATDADIEPTNVYAFYVPADQAPAPADRTTDFYFKRANTPNASVHAATQDASGNISLTVPGVTPSLTPYSVQTIVEYPN